MDLEALPKDASSCSILSPTQLSPTQFAFLTSLPTSFSTVPAHELVPYTEDRKSAATIKPTMTRSSFRILQELNLRRGDIDAPTKQTQLLIDKTWRWVKPGDDLPFSPPSSGSDDSEVSSAIGLGLFTTPKKDLPITSPTTPKAPIARKLPSALTISTRQTTTSPHTSISRGPYASKKPQHNLHIHESGVSSAPPEKGWGEGKMRGIFSPPVPSTARSHTSDIGFSPGSFMPFEQIEDETEPTN